jgi:hypothetical protein
MCRRNALGIAVLLVLGVGVCTWTQSATQGHVPYVPQGSREAVSAATRCPPSAVECVILGIYCVDWDTSYWCSLACEVACYAACRLSGATFWGGFACSVGCWSICWETCKYCEEWDVEIYCYCPGDPVPTAVQASPGDL